MPCAYGFWRLVYGAKEPELIIFADSHHDSMPFSMVKLHAELERRGYKIVDVICNYANMSQLRSSLHAISFMRLYAQAKFVFICDNFLPVSSCNKSSKTTVVQLLHSGGLMKKMGYHTTEDIPAGYRGDVYKNYDLVTVSAPCCVEPLTDAMRKEPGILQPLGTNRTDCYFDEEWKAACRRRFYEQYPQAVGKKVLLWTPTFRGNAAAPRQVGMEALAKLEAELGDAYFVIRKVHPHVDNRYQLSNCSIPTEELLPIADLMITDYSSVVMDFLLFDKPFVLFAPDLAEYVAQRGLYVDYYSVSPYVVIREETLKEVVLQALADDKPQWVREKREFHMANCDGKVSARIADYLGLKEE